MSGHLGAVRPLLLDRGEHLHEQVRLPSHHCHDDVWGEGPLDLVAPIRLSPCEQLPRWKDGHDAVPTAFESRPLYAAARRAPDGRPPRPL